VIETRLATLVHARVTSSARALSAAEIAKALQRFAPATYSEVAWRDAIAAIEAKGDDAFAGRTWPQLADKLLPAIALGVKPGDTKALARLSGRDAWTAAIAARALGMWSDGPPPSLAVVCDAYAWAQLGLPGKPKRCPDEIRAVFFQRALASEPGPSDRMVRLYAARALAAPRAEVKALRDALVRNWLAGKSLSPSFAGQVGELARAATTGVFGDRKVFIASVWDELKRQPAYATLTLDAFKQQLVRAHRDGELVLARADLVAAMDPALVAASETTTDGASFHFIVREEPA
jgi:hypothetical protein